MLPISLLAARAPVWEGASVAREAEPDAAAARGNRGVIEGELLRARRAASRRARSPEPPAATPRFGFIPVLRGPVSPAAAGDAYRAHETALAPVPPRLDIRV